MDTSTHGWRVRGEGIKKEKVYMLAGSFTAYSQLIHK